MPSDREDVFSQARKTPLARPAITELAKSVGAGRLKEHAPAALDAAGLHVATVIAFALVAAGETLEPTFAAKLLAELDADEHVGPLARAAGPEGAVKALTLVLDDADATSHRKALALLTLADVLGGKPAPEDAVTHARQLARYAIEADSSVLLGAAAARLGDDGLASLAAPYVKAAKKQRKVVDDALEDSRRPALDALAETASRGIAVGFTVRREGPAPGRNDACPCGSGKKYKKCCALKSETPSFEPGRIDEVTLAEEQAEALRASELVQLDVTRVPKRAFVAAFKRAVAVRRWDLVDRFIAEAARRPREFDQKVLEDMHYLALEAAILARAPDVAEKHLAKLPKKYTDAVALDLAFLRDEPGVIALLEEAAIGALHQEHDGALAIELAHAILPYRPALGILVARGALHEGRVRECQRLLEKVEDARDRLLLAPVEPWWDFYEAMIEEADDQREERARVAGEKELRAELKRARQAARKASSEIAKLQDRQKEIEDALSTKPLPKKEKDRDKRAVPTPPVERPADLEEEKKRLKQKIDELQRIIGEGQEERRDLRRKLQDVVEEAKPAADDDDDDVDETPEPDEPGDGIDAPRNVLVPRFSDRASKSMGDLTTAVADGVLSTIAGLAAGRPNAWSYVKQLTKVRGVFSARAGIHHRVLFATSDRGLDVLEVIHRKDLEQAVDRLTVSR